MKTLSYEREQMVRAGRLLNSITVTGVANCRLMAELADILDSGIPGEMTGPDTGADKKEEGK